MSLVIVAIDALPQGPVSTIGSTSILKVVQQAQVVRPDAPPFTAEVAMVDGVLTGLSEVVGPGSPVSCGHSPLTAAHPADLRVAVTGY